MYGFCHVFSQPGVFSGFWGIGFLLFFHCFLIVFPLFLCWNICWNVGCVVFVVLIVDVCVVILVHHQKWCPIPINIGVRKNDEKYLTKRWWLYYCLWGEWFVCLFVVETMKSMYRWAMNRWERGRGTYIYKNMRLHLAMTKHICNNVERWSDAPSL